ncbi:MAG TPA: hypothetical protein VI316_08435 [Candidatus Dormibacteraeota bacterium]
MNLPAILVYDPKDKLNHRSGRALLERSEDMLKALRAHCSVALRACDDDALAEDAGYLLEEVFSLAEGIPPPLPGGDKLFGGSPSEMSAEDEWFRFRDRLYARADLAHQLDHTPGLKAAQVGGSSFRRIWRQAALTMASACRSWSSATRRNASAQARNTSACGCGWERVAGAQSRMPNSLAIAWR